ncbi:hypothetical protein BDR04DRAFT_420531 [Suillus decipiens]|nr:hypothetical protein BDR04DRAFT_420531 [Suillus decipiens]
MWHIRRCAIQLAGITTASLHNTEFLSSLDATHEFDPFDTHSFPEAQDTAHDIITTGGTFITVTQPRWLTTMRTSVCQLLCSSQPTIKTKMVLKLSHAARKISLLVLQKLLSALS